MSYRWPQRPQGSRRPFWRNERLKAYLEILELHPVRAMDALHIARALEWGADLFASADDRQLAVAKRVGLRTLHT